MWWLQWWRGHKGAKWWFKKYNGKRKINLKIINITNSLRCAKFAKSLSKGENGSSHPFWRVTCLSLFSCCFLCINRAVSWFCFASLLVPLPNCLSRDYHHFNKCCFSILLVSQTRIFGVILDFFIFLTLHISYCLCLQNISRIISPFPSFCNISVGVVQSKNLLTILLPFSCQIFKT